MNKLLSGRRILVVEDEMLIVFMIESMLADLGCECVTTAATVVQALALIEEQDFDAALLDINLNGDNSRPVANALAARGNRSGDCWNTSQRYQYPGELGIRFYNNRYRSDRYRHRHWHDKRTWRDEHHDSDRGYYRDGVWVTF